MEKLIYIIRHGQTDLNKQGIVQGRGIDSPLNAQGRREAEAFYKAYKDIAFDKVYTSTLQRTFQTIEQFVQDGVPHEVHEGLDEISWGKYEGQPQTPEIMTGFMQLTTQWKNGALDVAVENGESPLQLIERQKMAMDHILSRSAENTVLICMHGRAMRILLAWMTGADASRMDQFKHTNTALYILQRKDHKVHILDAYNIQHLAEFKNL